jgi:hypothetical protein
LEKILQCLGLPYNSLSELPTLCLQPLLLDDAVDCTNVLKVFLLGVPTVIDGHVKVGIVRKSDLEDMRFFLGRDDVCLSYVQDGWPLLSCPFLYSEFFNPLGDLRVALILVSCQNPVLSISFLKEHFGGTRRNPAA